jgi:hypothetical protein
MTRDNYFDIMGAAKNMADDMDLFFTWLEVNPDFTNGELAPIEIELSFLCFNIAYEAFMMGANHLSEYEQ